MTIYFNQKGKKHGRISIRQLKILRRIAAGEVLLHDQNKSIFYRASNPKERVTSSGKSLLRKAFASEGDFPKQIGVKKINITPAGRNEMGYSRGIPLE